jgi:hypothetical protein
MLSLDDLSAMETNSTPTVALNMGQSAALETVTQTSQDNATVESIKDQLQHPEAETDPSSESVEMIETSLPESSPVEMVFDKLEDQVVESIVTLESVVESPESALVDEDIASVENEQLFNHIPLDADNHEIVPEHSEESNNETSAIEPLYSMVHIVASDPELEEDQIQSNEQLDSSTSIEMQLLNEQDTVEEEQQTTVEVNVSDSSIQIAIPGPVLEEAEIETTALSTETIEEREAKYQTPVKVVLNTNRVHSLIINNTSVIESPSPMSRLMQPVEIDPPTPTLEDVTATITLSSLAQLEDDKAILRSFLDRAAASKENRTTIGQNQSTDCARRESLQNRRDSDSVRQALASPRQPLENKDGNTFCPQKSMQADPSTSPDIKKVEAAVELERILPPIDELLSKSTGKSSPRRSKRSKSSGSHPNIVMPDKKQISLRRNDGNDTLTLTKSESQLIALETRRNTRKNKGSALSVQDRIVKWRADLTVLGIEGASPGPKGPKVLKEPKKEPRIVKWSETLNFLNEVTGQSEEAPLLDNAQAPKTAEVSDTIAESSPEEELTPAPKPKRKAKQPSTKSRRVRGLGVTNGTPARGVLATTLLPDELADAIEERAVAEKQATVTITAVGTPSIKTNKSRLQQPSKLNLNPSIKSVSITSDSKDDTQKSVQIKKLTTSKKQVSMLPVAGTSSKRGVRK